MTTLSDLAYGEKGMLIDVISLDNNIKIVVNLKKTFYRENGVTYYFIDLYLNDGKGTHNNMGYMYFMLDEVTKTSSYVGTYVKPEYRFCGLASLLTSYYIKTVLDDGYENLLTNKKQRKPFLLYMLKKYSYDLLDKEDLQSSYKIHICGKDNDLTKYLIFENDKHRATFMRGKVFKEDNYHVLPVSIADKPDDIKLLDVVIPSRIYKLEELNKGYHLALNKINKVNENGIKIG